MNDPITGLPVIRIAKLAQRLDRTDADVRSWLHKRGICVNPDFPDHVPYEAVHKALCSAVSPNAMKHDGSIEYIIACAASDAAKDGDTDPPVTVAGLIAVFEAFGVNTSEIGGHGPVRTCIKTGFESGNRD